MNYFLAVDIGASSGRLILSHMAEGKIVLEEMLEPHGTYYLFTQGENKIQLDEYQLKELAHVIKMFLNWNLNDEIKY